jgi:ankyrin repeat protein
VEIHTCASSGDCDGIRQELAKGVSVDARDERDYTPLAYAAKIPDADEEVLRLLIDSGADVNATVDEEKHRPVELAACSGNLGKVQLLLDAGADIKYVSPKGYTILVNVMYSLHDDEMLVPMIVLLVKNGAEMDCETDYGESPLSVAAFQGRFDAVKFLLKAGADETPLQWTELMKAVALGTCDDVKRLLGENARLDDRDRWNRTPWLLTPFVDEVEKAKLLQSAGARINEQARGGYTASMYCALHGNADMLQWLLEIGSDIEAVDDARYTALMFAAEAGQTKCVQLLLQAGAEPARKNDYDENAMGIASNEKIVRLLAGAGADISDISTKMKRTLTGLHGSKSLQVSKSEYVSGMRPRFGRSNPEIMDIAFWRAMVRAGISAYEAKVQYDDAENMDDAAWCFSRYGMSFTELPDGRFVQIGGEREDFYDPDFYIYNDVTVHQPSGGSRLWATRGRSFPRQTFIPPPMSMVSSISLAAWVITGRGSLGLRQFTDWIAALGRLRRFSPVATTLVGFMSTKQASLNRMF